MSINNEYTDLIEAKRKLYLLLLLKKTNDLTVTEIETALNLARDKDIQNLLAGKLKAKRG